MLSFFELKGDYLQRFEAAKKLIAEKLNITTKF